VIIAIVPIFYDLITGIIYWMKKKAAKKAWDKFYKFEEMLIKQVLAHRGLKTHEKNIKKYKSRYSYQQICSFVKEMYATRQIKVFTSLLI
jgi:uncharacterized protein YneF (UPF0154 family)